MLLFLLLIIWFGLLGWLYTLEAVTVGRLSDKFEITSYVSKRLLYLMIVISSLVIITEMSNVA